MKYDVILNIKTGNKTVPVRTSIANKLVFKSKKEASLAVQKLKKEFANIPDCSLVGYKITTDYKDPITLTGHDGSTKTLIYVGENTFTFAPHSYTYIRIIGEDEQTGECQAVDPDGGPMLSVGSNIDGTNYLINKILKMKIQYVDNEVTSYAIVVTSNEPVE